jgi:hypothetical protein
VWSINCPFLIFFHVGVPGHKVGILLSVADTCYVFTSCSSGLDKICRNHFLESGRRAVRVEGGCNWLTTVFIGAIGVEPTGASPVPLVNDRKVTVMIIITILQRLFTYGLFYDAPVTVAARSRS